MAGPRRQPRRSAAGFVEPAALVAAIILTLLTVRPSVAAEVAAEPGVEAEALCSPLKLCRVAKSTWTKRAWKTDYVKELKIEQFCRFSRPSLQLEPKLGIELWIFDAEKDSKDPIQSRPHVTVNLYTYKLTHVVASGSALADATSIGFSYRPTPDSKSIIEVSCVKD